MTPSAQVSDRLVNLRRRQRAVLNHIVDVGYYDSHEMVNRSHILEHIERAVTEALELPRRRDHLSKVPCRLIPNEEHAESADASNAVRTLPRIEDIIAVGPQLIPAVVPYLSHTSTRLAVGTLAFKEDYRSIRPVIDDAKINTVLSSRIFLRSDGEVPLVEIAGENLEPHAIDARLGPKSGTFNSGPCSRLEWNGRRH